MTFDDAVEFVFKEEGIGSDDPDDSGRLTKWGISSRAHPEVLDPAFSREDALSIYWKDYWQRCHCDELPDPLKLLILDTAVNHGPLSAIRWLQAALGITPDGMVGPLTIRAASSASPDISIAVLTSRAIAYAGDAEFLHFGRGWMGRLFRLQIEILKGSA